MNPIMLPSRGSQVAEYFNALLVRMGSIQSEFGTDTDSSAESGATAIGTPMHATDANSGAGAAGNPMFSRQAWQLNKSLHMDQEKVEPVNHCSLDRKKKAQQLVELRQVLFECSVLLCGVPLSHWESRLADHGNADRLGTGILVWLACRAGNVNLYNPASRAHHLVACMPGDLRMATR